MEKMEELVPPEPKLGYGSESLLFNKVFKPVSQNKTLHGSSHVLLKPRKPTGTPLTHLGCTERHILHYLAGRDLAYHFRIADIVHNTGLSTKVVYEALHRLQKRGLVVKVARGVYRLPDHVIDLFNNGYTVPLCVEPVDKPVDNLGCRGGVDVGGRGVLGGWGVLRGHVLMPGGNWLQFFAIVFLGKLLFDWFFDNVVYRHLVGVYGPWRLRVIMSRVRSLFSYLKYYSRQVVLGCHGQYNGSPGGFSPLTDCVDGAHYYERGFDDVIPGWLAVVLDIMFSIFKVYVKTPEEVKEGNPEYYQDLLRELGEPPPMPREFADLVGSLMRLIA